MDNVSVSMGGFTFKSVHGCETFVLEHIPGNSYAHFDDIISLLQCSWGHIHVGVQETWEKKNALTKAGFTSQGEAVILASMDTVLPSCLGNATCLFQPLGRTKVGLAKVFRWDGVKTSLMA
jgi:hypothetical protein